MPGVTRLEGYLARHRVVGEAAQSAAADVVLSLADAARRVAALLAKGPLAGSLAAVRAEAHWGDSQKELDVLANRLMVDALANAPVAIIGSEEMDEPFVATADAPLAVAIDPLDGSDNIETGAPVGTIFSVLPRVGDADPAASLLQRGSAQIAAGYFMYGSRTMLALTFGQGTQVFTLNPQSGDFILTTASVAIPRGRANTPSTAPTSGIGTKPSGSMSAIARRGPPARAAPTSTPAGTLRWWRKPRASCCAAASISIPAMPAPATATGACGWSMRRTRWL